MQEPHAGFRYALDRSRNKALTQSQVAAYGELRAQVRSWVQHHCNTDLRLVEMEFQDNSQIAHSTQTSSPPSA